MKWCQGGLHKEVKGLFSNSRDSILHMTTKSAVEQFTIVGGWHKLHLNMPLMLSILTNNIIPPSKRNYTSSVCPCQHPFEATCRIKKSDYDWSGSKSWSCHRADKHAMTDSKDMVPKTECVKLYSCFCCLHKYTVDCSTRHVLRPM